MQLQKFREVATNKWLKEADIPDKDYPDYLEIKKIFETHESQKNSKNYEKIWINCEST